MELYLVRHAQSAFNRWHHMKWLKPWEWFVKDPFIWDAKLTEKGIQQTIKARQEYADIIKRTELIICSPLSRTIMTMQGVFAEAKCPVILTPLIAEKVHHSCDIGLPLKELKEKYTNYQFCHFEEELWWYHKGEDPKGIIIEPWENVKHRADKIKEFLKTRDEKVIAMVSHGNFIRSFMDEVIMFRNCQIKKVEGFGKAQ
ncbi:unnamed protein product [Blepharisma stoltei]|uniref:Phosphoglycerate mutase n=1 Tax=Blepharisma stoltei TaxID=1481888 RepID=A0AAU9IM99_9CILI|nr:unnamed protein product [Blepharisma stoltei]